MNMKDIIEWRDTSRLSVKLDENDLIRICLLYTSDAADE